MKVVMAEFSEDNLGLRLYTLPGVIPGSYLGGGVLIPNDVDPPGFKLSMSTNDIPQESQWLKEFISTTIGVGESPSDKTMNYLKLYIRTMLESTMFRSHIMVSAESYSEILLYEVIDKYINHLINYATAEER